MKTNDPLDDLLSSWNPTPDVDAAFRHEVWQRIAAAGNERARTVASPFRIRLSAIAAVVVVAGFGLGLLGGNSPDRERAAYFNRIDPIAQTR